jgi:hypothetical protein
VSESPREMDEINKSVFRELLQNADDAGVSLFLESILN